MYIGGKQWKKISLENRIIALRILTFNDLIEVISNIQVIKMVFKIFLLKKSLTDSHIVLILCQCYLSSYPEWPIGYLD